jgi:hypothetical protein
VCCWWRVFEYGLALVGLGVERMLCLLLVVDGSFGTLLGFEATGFLCPCTVVVCGWGVCWFLFPGHTVPLLCGGVGVMGLLFENYIVDASILY